MEYKVKLTDECEDWLLNLNDSEKTDVLAVIGLLEDVGPNLGYPYSSKINGSKYSRMRELRIQHRGKPYRILYAFDPTRTAILLIGGNKSGDKRWYRKFIAIADKLYTQYLKSEVKKMTKSLQTVRKKISPKVVAAAKQKTRRLMAELPLQELRHARKLSQEKLAKSLRVRQASVSKLERRTDMYISTLRNFVRAMGGDIEINAIFPEGSIRISQFQKINKRRSSKKA